MPALTHCKLAEPQSVRVVWALHGKVQFLGTQGKKNAALFLPAKLAWHGPSYLNP